MKLIRNIPGVRPFAHADVPAVASLHWNVFGDGSPLTEQLKSDYQTYFSDVYLNNPSSVPAVESLVYESTGRITGFLGAVGRHMKFRGEPMLAANATNFAVSPGSRGLAGTSLIVAFLAGPQDLSIADEATADAERLWTGLGGGRAPLHSIRWLSLLSPARAALHLLGRRRGLWLPSSLLRPVAGLVDLAMKRLSTSPLRIPESQLLVEPLEPSAILSHADELLNNFALRSAYNEASLNWMLRRAENMKSRGPLQKVLLRTTQGCIAGWYLYYAKPGGIGEVIQIAAVERKLEDVMNHLNAHARERGAVGLAGRLEPGLADLLSRGFCVFDRKTRYVFLHSRRAEILDAFQRGDVFFSRLEGEWCMHFRD